MHRLPGLDLLRAIAVIWVMLFHSFIVGGLGPHFDWLSRYGWVGVDIFFVLSGLLIGSQLLRPLHLGTAVSLTGFYARRAWRILPAYFVVLAVYVCFPLWREVPGMQPGWQFATFTLNLLVDYQAHPAFSHAWSLCVEEHFYLFFPLLAVAFARRPSISGALTAYVVLVAFGIALRSAVWLHDTAADPARNWYIEDIYYPTWMRLDGLAVGVMLAVVRVYRTVLWERMQARSGAWLLAGSGLFAAALWLFRDRTGLLANAVGWPLMSLGIGMIVFAAAALLGLLGRRPWPLASWLAGISYSLYLSHKLAYHATQVWVEPHLAGHGMVLFAVYGAAALGLGAVLHYTVERPCLRGGSRQAMKGSGDRVSRSEVAI